MNKTFRWSALACASLVAAVCAQTPAGLPDMTFPEDELFTFISQIPVEYDPSPEQKWVWGENPEFPLLLNGYVIVGCRDAYPVFDFSDPYNPVLVKKNVVTADPVNYSSYVPEFNGWGMTTGYGGVHMAHADEYESLDFWDFTDHTNAKKVSTVDLPMPWRPYKGGGPEGCPDYHAGFGGPIAHAWQAPYLYSVMRGVGLDIIDVHDIENPTVAKRVDYCDYPERGYMAIGVVNVVGNLLIHSAHVHSRYIQVMDISDPENPVELDFVGGNDTPLKNLYCGFINGNRYFASGPAVHEYDISDPTNITFVRTYNRTGECNHECSTGGTCVQDNFLHWGGSRTGYEKFDLTTGESVGVTGPLTNPEKPDDPQYADMDLVTVFGNLTVVCSEDQYQVITLVPHQSEPDRNPPVVNMVNPVDGAQDMATTSRVGFTFTDNIDHRSLNIQTVIVRPEGGEAINGKFSVNKSIVNFSPDVCLEANTCYEVVVPAGGVRDYAGNATAEEFTSTFCTGSSGNESVCEKRAANPTIAGALRNRGVTGHRAHSRFRAAVVHHDLPRGISARIYDTRGRLLQARSEPGNRREQLHHGVVIVEGSTGNRPVASD